MARASTGGEPLRMLVAAVRLAAQRETSDPAGRPPAPEHLIALTSAANLLEELAKAADEGARRTRGLKGRLALWLGGVSSRLIR